MISESRKHHICIIYESIYLYLRTQLLNKGIFDILINNLLQQCTTIMHENHFKYGILYEQLK